jgi:hypothetical protein
LLSGLNVYSTDADGQTQGGITTNAVSAFPRIGVDMHTEATIPFICLQGVQGHHQLPSGDICKPTLVVTSPSAKGRSLYWVFQVPVPASLASAFTRYLISSGVGHPSVDSMYLNPEFIGNTTAHGDDIPVSSLDQFKDTVDTTVVMNAFSSAPSALRLSYRSFVDSCNLGSLSDDSLGILSSARNYVPSGSIGKNGIEKRLIPVDTIARYSHWSMETTKWTAPWVAVDLDHSDSIDRLVSGSVPMPSFIIANTRTGHAQAFWSIFPIRKNNRPGMAFYNKIRRRLNEVLGGDMNFSNHRVQNPYWDGIDKGSYREVYVPDGCARRMSLTDIYKWFTVRGQWDTVVTPSSASHVESMIEACKSSGSRMTMQNIINELENRVWHRGERNAGLFAVATWLAWHGGDPELIRTAHCEPAMNDAELGRIIQSVNRYHTRKTASNPIGKHKHAKSSYLSRIGRKGGIASTIAQRKSRSLNLSKGSLASRKNASVSRRKAYAANLVSGSETVSCTAKRLGMSRQTLYKHLHAVKAGVVSVIADQAVGADKEWNQWDDPLVIVNDESMIFDTVRTVGVVSASRDGPDVDDDVGFL